jgi:hypothetical protein
MHQLSSDEDLNLRFEILRGSDISQFKLNLKYKRSNVESSLIYLSWSNTGTSYPRSVTEYPEDSGPEPHTFSSFLRGVTFRKVTCYDEDVEAARTWHVTSGNYSLIVPWLSDEAPIGKNLKISTQTRSDVCQAKFKT